MDLQDKALIIFIKNPELGKVKTRLAQSIGAEAALAAYRDLLTHTRLISAQVEARRYLFYSSDFSREDAWSEAVFEKYVQHPGDLGERMRAAFEVVLKNHKKAVIIGSDCPKLRPTHITQAYDLLNERDVVLGPTYDGGYYLLGMSKFHSFLFDNMAWSTSAVCRITSERIKSAQLSEARLEKLSDVDYELDWIENRNFLWREL